MNRITNSFWIVLLVLFISSCSSKKENQNHDDEPKEEAALEDDWKEMDDFHMIMAEAFHPFKDSMNLAPAKEIAAEMAQDAAKWVDAPLPSRVNIDEVKEKLKSLRDMTASFESNIKNGSSDEQIGLELNKLHDLFHEIQESWYHASSHHH